MTRQAISTGTTANDGTGDTLRSAGTKINENFVELYRALGGDSDTLSLQVSLEDSAVVFEGATNNQYETRLTAVDPTADRQVQLPNASGIIVLDTNTQTLTNKTLTTPTISSPKITTAINDTNNNELIKFTATASAVNELTIANAVSGNSPTISATGSDTNLNVDINSKGTGTVDIRKLSFTNSEISATGTASQLASYIICNGSSITVTVADGTVTGEYKIFTNKNASTATITPTNFANGTSFALPQNNGATCIWDGSNWFLLTQDLTVS